MRRLNSEFVWLRPQILSICLALLLFWSPFFALLESNPSNVPTGVSGPESIAELPGQHATVSNWGLSTVAQQLNTAIDQATAYDLASGDCHVVGCVALTFDDGPSSDATPIILDALEVEKVRATFFLVGNRLATSRSVAERIRASGHEIGNHSWSHSDFTKLSGAQIDQQMARTAQAFSEVGLAQSLTFRPPYGNRNAVMRQLVKLPIIMWNVDPQDWREKDPAKIAEQVIAQAKPGAIILLHDRLPTANALPAILRDLKSRYRLVGVSELLSLQPDSRGEFFSRTQ